MRQSQWLRLVWVRLTESESEHGLKVEVGPLEEARGEKRRAEWHRQRDRDHGRSCSAPIQSVSMSVSEGERW